MNCRKSTESLAHDAPWGVPPILRPLGPAKGESVLPLGNGWVVGDGLTPAIKDKHLVISRYHKEFGRG